MAEILKAIRALPEGGERRFLSFFLSHSDGMYFPDIEAELGSGYSFEAFKRLASTVELTAQDWKLVFCTNIIFPPVLDGNSPACQKFCQTLYDAGCRHPMLLRRDSSGLQKLLDASQVYQGAKEFQKLVSAEVSHRSSTYFSAGALTLKEALQSLPSASTIPIDQWAFQKMSIPEEYQLPKKVELWGCCDSDIHSCMSQLPRTKCIFPRQAMMEYWKVVSDPTVGRAWELAPTDTVNMGLRYLAYKRQDKEAHQWSRRIIQLPGETQSKVQEQATEQVEFTLKAGSNGDIVSAYDTAMGDVLMWHSDTADDRPMQYTTHPGCVGYGQHPKIWKHVAAYDLVMIYNSTDPNMDARLKKNAQDVIKRVIYICIKYNIKYMMFGNVVYTWAAKWEDNKLSISHAYPYCSLHVAECPFVGEVAFMVSYKAMQNASGKPGCNLWPLEEDPTFGQARMEDTMGIMPLLADRCHTSPEKPADVANKHDEIDQLDLPAWPQSVQGNAGQPSFVQDSTGQTSVQEVAINSKPSQIPVTSKAPVERAAHGMATENLDSPASSGASEHTFSRHSSSISGQSKRAHSPTDDDTVQSKHARTQGRDHSPC